MALDSGVMCNGTSGTPIADWPERRTLALAETRVYEIAADGRVFLPRRAKRISHAGMTRMYSETWSRAYCTFREVGL